MAIPNEIPGTNHFPGQSVEENLRRNEENLFSAFRQARIAYRETVAVLARIIEQRDPATAWHSERLTPLAVGIGRELGLGHDDLDVLETFTVLHDVGKIGVPSSILKKAGPLTSTEWKVMIRHPVIGSEIIGNAGSLRPAYSIVRHHHERFDGTGYPDSLVGEQIPLTTRIVSVADAFDAMITDRPYRKGLPPEYAVSELKKWAGRQFDPRVVEAALGYLAKVPLHPENGTLNGNVHLYERVPE